MNKADEMLEELGYKKTFENSNFIVYKFEGIYMNNIIRFDLIGKTVIKEYSSGESQTITLREYKAINQKYIEMGWLDERTSK